MEQCVPFQWAAASLVATPYEIVDWLALQLAKGWLHGGGTAGAMAFYASSPSASLRKETPHVPLPTSHFPDECDLPKGNGSKPAEFSPFDFKNDRRALAETQKIAGGTKTKNIA